MTKFKDPIAYKHRKTSATFVGPRKEQATTGRFMDAGDEYGIGHPAKVGTFGVTGKSPIPQKATCFDPKETIRG